MFKMNDDDDYEDNNDNPIDIIDNESEKKKIDEDDSSVSDDYLDYLDENSVEPFNNEVESQSDYFRRFFKSRGLSWDKFSKEWLEWQKDRHNS